MISLASWSITCVSVEKKAHIVMENALTNTKKVGQFSEGYFVCLFFYF